MSLVDRLLKFIVTAAVTVLLSGLIVSMILPKGLSLRRLPEFYSLVQKRKQNVDAWKFLETIHDEDEMLSLMTELHGIQPTVPDRSIATQATHREAVIDPAELERIDKMNISNELKAQMKLAYAQVGSIPKPVAADAAVDKEGTPVPPSPAAGASALASGELASVRAPASVTDSKSEPATFKRPESFEAALKDLRSEFAARPQRPNN